MAKFLLEIVSKQGIVFSSDNVDMVVVPGKEGDLGILANHAPLVSNLSKGVVRVKNGDEEETFDIEGGFVEVTKEKVMVLTQVTGSR